MLEVLILAVVQGVTEFLPVSSSGHLVIADALMSTPEGGAALNILLHAGTLLSILVFYHRRIVRLVAADRRVVGLLFVGTLPAVVIGFAVRIYGEPLLESPLLAGCLLLVTGGLLLFAARRPPGETDYVDLGYGAALLIGLFQAAAVFPGLSRSGATIVAGLLVGLRRDAAATFSFLLAIPVIGGASVLEIRNLTEGSGDAPAAATLLAGTATAFVVGLVSLALLVRWLEGGKLHYFAYWCLPVGLAVIAWRLIILLG